jgi:hypothetical protein
MDPDCTRTFPYDCLKKCTVRTVIYLSYDTGRCVRACRRRRRLDRARGAAARRGAARACTHVGTRYRPPCQCPVSIAIDAIAG